MQEDCLFRPLKASDAEALLSIYADEAAMQFRSSKPMHNLKDALHAIANQRVKDEMSLTVRQAIEVHGRVIGMTMLRYFDTNSKTCEIGYSIGRPYWNKGVGSTVVKLLVEQLQQDDQVRKICASCHRENIASIKILKNNAFVIDPKTLNSEILQLYKKLHKS